MTVKLYGRATDMRRSFDGLCALTRQELKEDRLSGALFVFVNKRGTQMKCVYFDRSGFLHLEQVVGGRQIHPGLAFGAHAEYVVG